MVGLSVDCFALAMAIGPDGWPRDSTNTQVFEKIMSGRGCVDFDAVSGVEWFADCAAIWGVRLVLGGLVLAATSVYA